MKQVVIENPVLNSPFREPTRHFHFTDEGITNEIEDGRRISSYFVPIARPKKKGKQRGQTLVILLAGGDKRTQDRDIRKALKQAREL